MPSEAQNQIGFAIFNKIKEASVHLSVSGTADQIDHQIGEPRW